MPIVEERITLIMRRYFFLSRIQKNEVSAAAPKVQFESFDYFHGSEEVFFKSHKTPIARGLLVPPILNKYSYFA